MKFITKYFQCSLFLLIALSVVPCAHSSLVAADGKLADNMTFLGKLVPKAPDSTAQGYSNIWGYSAKGREYALLGCQTGVSVIDVTDPKNPRQVSYFRSPKSIWREIRTWGHYCYFVHDSNDEADSTLQGIQIIDLSTLPDSARFVKVFKPANDQGFVHTVHTDNGRLFLMGTRSSRGLIMYDIASDPENPKEIGRYDGRYWHDMVAMGDTLIASAILDGYIQFVDAKTLKVISERTYPGAFTHNSWYTPDRKLLATTDEVPNRPMNFWDMSDITNLKNLAKFQGGSQSIAHNVHINGQYAHVSYYCDGIKIIDVHNPKAPVEVANFDSFPEDNFTRAQGFNGAWGVFPYLPSGNILISDMTHGLFVVQFDTVRAGYIEGIITDSVTSQPLSDVRFETLNIPANEGQTIPTVGADGKYAIGSKPNITRQVKLKKYGYEDYYMTYSVQAGETQIKNIAMKPYSTAPVRITVKNEFGEVLPNITVKLQQSDSTNTQVTNDFGQVAAKVLAGPLTTLIQQWGYQSKYALFDIKPTQAQEFEIVIKEGYFIDHVFMPEVTRIVRPEVGKPTNSNWLSDEAQKIRNPFPKVNYKGEAAGYYNYCTSAYARIMFQAKFNGLKFQNPTLEFYQWFLPGQTASGSFEDANDSLIVQISSDTAKTWRTIYATGKIDTVWRFKNFSIGSGSQLTDSMAIRFINLEGPDKYGRGVSYAAVSDVRIVPSNMVVGVAENPNQLIPRELLLQPNPANTEISIQSEQEIPAGYSIAIYTILGENILRMYDNGSNFTLNNSKSLNINTSSFSNGIYFLKLIDKAGQIIQTKEFIVLH